MNTNKITKILESVSQLEGIKCVSNFKHELGYSSGYIDNYLAIGVLGELIERGVIELKFNEPRSIVSKKKLEYFKKLLEEE